MNTAPKVIAWTDLPRWRQSLGLWQQPLVVTNGCFDVLHAGHATYLETAASWGRLLLVGINDDAGVRGLKGAQRPVNTSADRARVLAALACVDAVCVFPGPRATDFLARAQPQIYVKGGDYTTETLFPPEREVLERVRAEIRFVPLLAGRSTSRILERLRVG